MSNSPTNDGPNARALDAAYDEALGFLTVAMCLGKRRTILAAFRAVFVAEIALLRSSGDSASLAVAEGLESELCHLDRDLALRHDRRFN
jgi:hypothetical protein